MHHTIIKLGGSVITDKQVENTPRSKVIERLVDIINAYQMAADEKLWLFHGGGSMAHVAAARWQQTGDDEDFTAAKGGMVALNQMVIQNLASPYTVARARFFWDNPKAQWSAAVQRTELFVGHGDAVEVDGKKMIVSTEDQIESLVQFLGDAPKRILFLTDTAGVLDEDGKAVSELNANTLPALFKVDQADVTGGMASKLQAAFALVSNTTNITIASGFKAQNLANWLEGKAVEGTVLIK